MTALLLNAILSLLKANFNRKGVGLLRKLYLGNRLFIAFLFIASSICSLFISPLAKATSAFDDDYQKVSSVSVAASNYYGINCSAVDLTTSWPEYILDNTKWHDPNQTSGSNVDAKASLEAASENGRWIVSTGAQWGDSGYVRFVDVAWTEDNRMELDWSSGDGKIYAFSDTGSGVHTVRFYNENLYYGNGDCRPVMTSYGADSGIVVSRDKPWVAAPANSSQGGGYANLFANIDSAKFNYPANYAGDSIQSNTQGGTVTGSVQCANTNNVISAVQINVQSGVDGNAVLADDGIGGKEYSRHLWKDSPYSLVVLCDGDPFYGPTVDTNLYGIYNWVCATTGGQNVCAAS